MQAYLCVRAQAVCPAHVRVCARLRACVYVCVCVYARARTCMRSVSNVSLQEQARVCLHVTPCMCSAGSEEIRVKRCVYLIQQNTKQASRKQLTRTRGAVSPMSWPPSQQPRFKQGRPDLEHCPRFNVRLCSFQREAVFIICPRFHKVKLTLILSHWGAEEEGWGLFFVPVEHGHEISRFFVGHLNSLTLPP